MSKLNIIPSLSIIVALGACSSIQPPAYEKDKSPENRREYNGLKGVIQQQKDQSYLMSAELQKKCNAARIDHAVAESTGDDAQSKAQQAIIKATCVTD
ncbi:hypothetical protein KUL42_23490 [Alteromonas sp. KUL42]|uniref:hypothetical protein n=1 Tax=Alteromonas sp. KUL42 TaxID=2480797 RepID=UPI001036B5BB|nr:hypothetical protein [Alteromonas sp. KUL42]TAP34831.1 hypothetical protein EYR97_11565 [Alteromonas sp. KUL42]GEA07588.1 hypothetical protein KUL42_23490 [Alteromonas sp. KUL42]